jgi:hypothetical protein
MLPAHEEILSIQLVTNNKYARQVRSRAAGLKQTGRERDDDGYSHNDIPDLVQKK